MDRSSTLGFAGRVVTTSSLLLALTIGGCGSASDGQPGRTGTSVARLEGVVTNAPSGEPLTICTLMIEPDVPDIDLTVDSEGRFGATLPIGLYNLTCTADGFVPQTAAVLLEGGGPRTVDFSLAPEPRVIVTIEGAPTHAVPGDELALTARVSVMDGSTVVGHSWSQLGSVAADIVNGDSATPTITLSEQPVYLAAVLGASGALPRYDVVALNPHALGEASLVAFQVAVTTTSGIYEDRVEIDTELDFVAVNPGLRNVPLGKPVLFNGKPQPSYTWSFTRVPTGSTATLIDATTRNPYFVPDVSGKYVLSVHDEASASEVTIDIWAGTWQGMVAGVEEDGTPVPDSACTGCHPPNGHALGPDMFTPWRASGHARIFTDNVNDSDHYSSACFACHTVGYDLEVDDGGIDDQADYEDFFATMFPDGRSTPDSANFETAIANWPDTAKLTNVQCDNCHGPHNSGAHFFFGTRDPQTNIRSDVCAVCHGQLPRHGRYQQWLESGHADYELATYADSVASQNCARCHVGQGFLAWLPQLMGGNPGNLGGSSYWTEDSLHPITCAVCHQVHDVGTRSGSEADARMRIEDDTPLLPAGFRARNVGKGAVCMVCHNTRNGLHDDASYAVGGELDDTAPHTAAQADVLMARNAYFVTVGLRHGHSYMSDTCVTCHVTLSPPPADLSHELGGTNHTFEAERQVCSECHFDFDGGTLETSVASAIEALRVELGRALVIEIADQLSTPGEALQVTYHVGEMASTATFTSADALEGAQFVGTFHGSMAMSLTINGNVYGDIALGDAVFLLAGADVLHVGEGQTIARAAWNQLLIEGDGSSGAHNPSFSLQALEAARQAMRAAYP